VCHSFAVRPPCLRVVLLGLSLVVACSGTTPPSSLRGGRLVPCPVKPHCVSSDAAEDAAHAMSAIPFADTPAHADERAREALLAEPRTTIVDTRPGYLRAEARTRAFRFVDDVELLVDSAARRIQFRSSSRLGTSDWGVNRKRMERITHRLSAAP
jgi:uncharacterized protein (DUF1499 family)